MDSDKEELTLLEHKLDNLIEGHVSKCSENVDFVLSLTNGLQVIKLKVDSLYTDINDPFHDAYHNYCDLRIDTNNQKISNNTLYASINKLPNKNWPKNEQILTMRVCSDYPAIGTFTIYEHGHVSIYFNEYYTSGIVNNYKFFIVQYEC